MFVVRCMLGAWFSLDSVYLLRGNCSNDKLIRDNTGGVWLPRPGAGFTHLKLLSVCRETVCRVVGGWVGSFLFYCLPESRFSGANILRLRPHAFYHQSFCRSSLRVNLLLFENA